MGQYRTAMVCENGHLITDSLEGSPGMAAPYCGKCGAKTITACPKCGNGIRGHYHMDGVVDLTGPEPPPRHCHACGNPYPWTEAAIRAWRELVDESEGLPDEEKERLKGSIDDLIADTPGSNVAMTRVKKWIAKAGKEVGPAVRQIVVDVGTEAVKKSMGL